MCDFRKIMFPAKSKNELIFFFACIKIHIATFYYFSKCTLN